MRSIAVANRKGGVGKTTTSVNLAVALARAGKKVCLVDLDPQAHATLHVGVQPGAPPLSAYDVFVGEHSLAEASVAAGDNLTVVPSHIDLAAVEVALATRAGRESILKQRIETDPRCSGRAGLVCCAAVRQKQGQPGGGWQDGFPSPAFDRCRAIGLFSPRGLGR